MLVALPAQNLEQAHGEMEVAHVQAESTGQAVRVQASGLQTNWLELLGRYQWDLFGSLTFREATHPEAAYKRFRLFISILNRKIYGPRWAKHGQGIGWCVAMELQARGVIHFHCLLSDPALAALHLAGWRLGVSGKWEHEMNELWNKLAGFARIERIGNKEAVEQYVSKYVIKGGEIDLGGPIEQRTVQQANAKPIVNSRSASEAALANASDSVPGLPVHCGAGRDIKHTSYIRCSDGVDQVEHVQRSASNLSSIRSCSASQHELRRLAEYTTAEERAQLLARYQVGGSRRGTAALLSEVRLRAEADRRKARLVN